MKKERFVSLFLAVIMVFSFIPFGFISAKAETNYSSDTELFSYMKSVYDTLKARRGSSYNGYCGKFVADQIDFIGVGHQPNGAYNGNQWYDILINNATTQYGYKQVKYPGNNCLYDIVNNHGGGEVHNIIISFSHGYGSENWSFGHVTFIYMIKDGYVYLCESYDSFYAGSEGTPHKRPIDDFMKGYNNSYGNAIGAIHFEDPCDHSDCGYYKNGYCEVTDSWLPNNKDFIDEVDNPLSGIIGSVASTIKIKFGYYKHIDDSKWRLNRPYTITSGGNTALEMPKNAEVLVIGAVENGLGNIWYKIRYDGKEGYAYHTHFDYLREAPSALKINATASPSDSIPQSVGFSCKGTITSNYVLTSVEGYIIDSDGNIKYIYKGTPYKTSYDILNDGLDASMLFSRLSVGNYSYKIIATDASGERKQYSSSFSVYLSEQTYDYPGKPYLIGLRSVYEENEKIVFNWNPTEKTTHYNIYIDKKNDSGEWERIDNLHYVESGFSRQFEIGSYRVLLQSTNSNGWMPDNSTWLFTDGDWVSFTVGDLSHDDSLTIDENVPQLEIESKKVTVGSEFTLKVSIKNNPGVNTLAISPVYPNGFEFLGVENSDLFDNMISDRSIVFDTNDNLDIKTDGVVAYLKFKANDSTVAGEYTFSAKVITASNYDEDEVSFAVRSGRTLLIDFVYGDANNDGSVSASDIVRLKKYFAAYDPDTDTSTVVIGPGADANGDGIVSASDIVRLKKYFAAYDPDTDTSTVVIGPAN